MIATVTTVPFIDGEFYRFGINCGGAYIEVLSKTKERYQSIIDIEGYFNEVGELICTKTKTPQSIENEKYSLITVHFNPCGYKNLAKTYYEWIKRIDRKVKCYELVYNDNEPEIEGSIVINGTDDNFMWQQEALFNYAVSQEPDDIDYIFFLDHDLYFENPYWLEESIENLKKYDLIQCFESYTFLNRHNKPTWGYHRKTSATHDYTELNKITSFTGGAWAYRADFIKNNPLISYDILGGSDTRNFREFIKKGLRMSYTKGNARHIWHGDKVNRQYGERSKILYDNGFERTKHIELRNGIWSWKEGTPQNLKDAVKQYFLDRKEDG